MWQRHVPVWTCVYFLLFDSNGLAYYYTSTFVLQHANYSLRDGCERHVESSSQPGLHCITDCIVFQFQRKLWVMLDSGEQLCEVWVSSRHLSPFCRVLRENSHSVYDMGHLGGQSYAGEWLPCGTMRSADLSRCITSTLQNNSVIAYASVPQNDSDPQCYRRKCPNTWAPWLSQEVNLNPLSLKPSKQHCMGAF